MSRTDFDLTLVWTDEGALERRAIHLGCSGTTEELRVDFHAKLTQGGGADV
jgi:hypothetical protein